jgi:hypothetical protein
LKGRLSTGLTEWVKNVRRTWVKSTSMRPAGLSNR